MKKITLIVLLALSWELAAQMHEIQPLKKNELKVDVAYLIDGTIKGEYEYLLNDWSSIGMVVLYNFNSPDELYYRTQVLGTYRLFFGKIPMSGFFLEGNFGLISGRYDPADSWWPREYKPYTAFGMGLALGWKFHIPKSSIVLDLFAGAGRLIGDDNPGGYPRMGICVGKRF